jgi:aminopeptidase N/predicted small lipoprotein YifL
LKSKTASFFTYLMFILVVLSLAGCGSSSPAVAPDPEVAQVETEPLEPTQVVTEAPPPTLASTPDPSPGSGAAWDDRAIYRAGLIAAEQGALERLPGASVYHIDLQIPDDFRLLTGQQEVHYTNQEDEPLDEIYFRIFPNVAGGTALVSNVKVDGKNVEAAYEFEDSALRVPLPTALGPGEEAAIQMDFEVEVAREMGGNYGLFGYFDGVLVLDEFYPVIPVYDDEGWNVEVPPPNGDITYYDASFYLVRVTTPAELTVVASGVETAREEAGDQQVWTFAAGPARDFYLAAAENLIAVSDEVGETMVNSYTLPEWEAGAELALQYARNALDSFSQRFGTYPYTEFDVISTPMLALGIEYPGMTAVRLGLYDLDAEFYGLPAQVMLESTVAHEVAHQWFYNAVGNDQIDEPWLDEALVQYVTSLYFLDTYGEAAARNFRGGWDWRWNQVDRAEIPVGLPSGAYAQDEYGPIVYGRGPYFIEALAEEMGQEAFDEFLRDYYASHRWGIGTGDAFRQLAERHCDCDLSQLFEEWVYEKASS